MKRAIFPLAIAATVFAGASAYAAEPTQIVDFHPADLATEAGQASIRADILRAADQVCSNTDTRALSLRSERKSCLEAAVSEGEALLRERVLEAGYLHFTAANVPLGIR